MRLIIIFCTKVIITCVGNRSHKARIQWLSHMGGETDIVMERIWHPGTKLRGLTKLFQPIKKNADRNHIKPVFPIQRTFKKCKKTYAQDHQCKEVPPNEPRCLLGLVPTVLNRVHGFSSHHLFILVPLSLRKLIKNNLFFKRSQTRCP